MTQWWQLPPDGFVVGPCIGGRADRTRVFAASDPSGAPCALKTLAPAAGERAVDVARFTVEADAHIAASGIPGIAKARAVSGAPGWLVIVWAHGGDMAAAAERDAATRERIASRADDVTLVVLMALEGLHARGIAHRDIKPSNVLLDADSTWLTDFGIAARRRGDGWEALPAPWRELGAGTGGWSAPELARTPPAVTAASDIYAVAMLSEWMAKLAAAPSSAASPDTHSPHARHDMRDVLLHRMRAPEPIDRPTAAEARASWLRIMSSRDARGGYGTV